MRSFLCFGFQFNLDMCEAIIGHQWYKQGFHYTDLINDSTFSAEF